MSAPEPGHGRRHHRHPAAAGGAGAATEGDRDPGPDADGLEGGHPDDTGDSSSSSGDGDGDGDGDPSPAAAARARMRVQLDPAESGRLGRGSTGNVVPVVCLLPNGGRLRAVAKLPRGRKNSKRAKRVLGLGSSSKVVRRELRVFDALEHLQLPPLPGAGSDGVPRCFGLHPIKTSKTGKAAGTKQGWSALPAQRQAVPLPPRTPRTRRPPTLTPPHP